ncbi:hypothetical protein BJ741DRAFT_622363 [Chytriomyces cf. hyalinus JEL632]|nr:hypothetical protein BJ741DRAFT_622363 [Chytriomyces cf. hyalinus JEL632]
MAVMSRSAFRDEIPTQSTICQREREKKMKGKLSYAMQLNTTQAFESLGQSINQIIALIPSVINSNSHLALDILNLLAANRVTPYSPALLQLGLIISQLASQPAILETPSVQKQLSKIRTFVQQVQLPHTKDAHSLLRLLRHLTASRKTAQDLASLEEALLQAVVVDKTSKDTSLSGNPNFDFQFSIVLDESGSAFRGLVLELKELLNACCEAVKEKHDNCTQGSTRNINAWKEDFEDFVIVIAAAWAAHEGQPAIKDCTGDHEWRVLVSSTLMELLSEVFRFCTDKFGRDVEWERGCLETAFTATGMQCNEAFVNEMMAVFSAIPPGPEHSSSSSRQMSSDHDSSDFSDEMVSTDSDIAAEFQLQQTQSLFDEGMDVPITFNQLCNLARNRHAKSQCNLGLLYYNAYVKNGHQRDYERALHWYKLASRQGLMQAQYNLALLFYSCPDVQLRSDVKALHWMRAAAQQQYAPAEYMMGLFYDLGHCVEAKDMQTAKTWYFKAAKHGSSIAEDQLISHRWM